MRRQRSGGAPCSRGGPAERRSAPTREQLCCCSPPAEPPGCVGGSKRHQSPGFPPCSLALSGHRSCILQAFCRALCAKGKRNAFSRQQPWILLTPHGGPRAFFSSDLQTPFLCFWGDLCLTASFVSHSQVCVPLSALCPTATLLPRPACICKAEMKRSVLVLGEAAALNCTSRGISNPLMSAQNAAAPVWGGLPRPARSLPARRPRPAQLLFLSSLPIQTSSPQRSPPRPRPTFQPVPSEGSGGPEDAT